MQRMWQNVNSVLFPSTFVCWTKKYLDAFFALIHVGIFCFHIELLVNFPHRGKIENFDMYGKQDLSFIVDMEKTRFPIKRSIIKEKAKEIFGDVETEDAYMYEGKEGVKVFLGQANEAGRKEERIDILPHSLHVWYEFTDKVTEFCDWLLENVYLVKDVDHKGETKYEKFRVKQKEENL